MNKKELAYLKKQFKVDGTLVRINHLHSVYINRDNRDVSGTMYSKFNEVEDDFAEMIIKNIKKVLTGKFDIKIFEQLFYEENKNDYDGCYTILSDMRTAKSKDDFVEKSNHLINKIIKNYTYDMSVVVNCVHFTFFSKNDSYDMILCTTNKTEREKTQVVYNHSDEIFDTITQLDPIINLQSPIDGFMYPIWEYETINVDKVLYYSSKANEVNTTFVYKILNCDIKLSAKQEKNYFHNILNSVMGGKIKPNVLLNIYKEITNRVKNEEDEENKVIDKSVLESILKYVDIEIDKEVEDAFNEILGDPNYKFKTENIVPDKDKKSINIGNTDSEIKITPKNLSNIRQVQSQNGEVFLVVRLNENLQTEGFHIAIDSMDEFNKLIGIE